jgi:hypothetical protein
MDSGARKVLLVLVNLLRASGGPCRRVVALGLVVSVVLGLVTVVAGPAGAVTDTEPPELVEFGFTPTTGDTSGASQTITVTLRITDDVEAVGSFGTNVRFSSPSGESMRVDFDSTKRIEGTIQNGVYQAFLVLPSWSERGTWRVTDLYLRDAAGRSAYRSGDDLAADDFPTTFEQTGDGDTAAPVLSEFSISPAIMDTSEAAATVTVEARITDDVSGLPTSYPCCNSVQFSSPNGGVWVSFDASRRISGDALNGLYRSTVELPRYSPRGTWQVTSASFTDAAGNSESLSSADFVNAGFSTSFQQTAVGDSAPPVLASVSVTPAEVDTSASVQTIIVTARITDDVAGLGSSSGTTSISCPYLGPGTTYGAALSFSAPPGGRAVSVCFDASKRTEGTPQNGLYQATVDLPRYSANGVWRLSSAWLSDAASRSKYLSVAELSDPAVAASFEQTGPGDTAAPVLAGLAISPSGVDASGASAAARTVTVTAHITDDLSGLVNTNGCCPSNSVSFFRSPSGGRTITATIDSARRTSGSATDGIYELAVVLPRYAERGTWRLSGLYLNDAAGYSRSLTANDAAAAGFPTSFEQTGIGDTTPPVVASLTLSPATVDTSTSSQTITITAHITDDLAGLGPNTPSFWFGSPSLGQGTSSASGDIRLVSGHARDATLEIPVVVPRFAEAGTWRMGSVFLSDALGNSRNLTPADLAAGGFPTTFEVAPVAPGAPTAVGAAPGSGSAVVSWSAPAANGASPLTGYHVTAYDGATPVATVAVAAPATTTTVAGLVNGRAYTFAVTATNGSGTGPASARSVAVTPRTVPGAPTGVVASAGAASASVSWTAPGSNGGSAVSSYTVTAYAGAAAVQTLHVAAPATSTTLTGLANGSTYTFAVAATNAAGAGPPSTSAAVVPRPATITPTPVAPPGDPVDAPVEPAPPPTRSGYWMVGADGQVWAFGDAPKLGAPTGHLGSARAVDLEPTRSGAGYRVVDDQGHVFAYGDASWLGNADPARLAAGERVISLSSTTSGDGYWIFTTRGRVLAFGDAAFYGDVAHITLNGPVIDSIPTASGDGYYMVASDGGIFTFGDATFHGSMGGQPLNAPVQSLVPDGDGVGYWLVASDGGVFAFHAAFQGSLGSVKLNQPITGMVRYGGGYLMVAKDGGVFDFSGDPKGFQGSLGSTPPATPVVSVAALAR